MATKKAKKAVEPDIDTDEIVEEVEEGTPEEETASEDTARVMTIQDAAKQKWYKISIARPEGEQCPFLKVSVNGVHTTIYYDEETAVPEMVLGVLKTSRVPVPVEMPDGKGNIKTEMRTRPCYAVQNEGECPVPKNIKNMVA